ncbi:VOC family protein [Arcobacter sp. YIC-310]|uniref:VOC family protein n=1 Tax=Arcobacter sp. YIC-310 TaxID=3376632 RepID=UPI003C1693D8
MKSLSPNLAVKDIKESVAYYQNNFGFEIEMLVDSLQEDFNPVIKEDKEYIWALIKKGDVSLMLQEKNSIKEDIGNFFNDITASITLYIEVDDVESLYEKVKENVDILKPVYETWYGQKEFYIKDINGYILGFSSKA